MALVMDLSCIKIITSRNRYIISNYGILYSLSLPFRRFWSQKEGGGGGVMLRGGTMDDCLQLTDEAAALDPSSQNPEICVTNVMGDEIKLVFSEPMDESH
jgi:hypothetical protein